MGADNLGWAGVAGVNYLQWPKALLWCCSGLVSVRRSSGDVGMMVSVVLRHCSSGFVKLKLNVCNFNIS